MKEGSHRQVNTAQSHSHELPHTVKTADTERWLPRPRGKELALMGMELQICKMKKSHTSATELHAFVKMTNLVIYKKKRKKEKLGLKRFIKKRNCSQVNSKILIICKT